MASRSERMIGHTGTETRSRLLREAAVGNLAQWALSLTQRCRVSEEGLRVVKLCPEGKMMYRLISYASDGTSEESTG
jgi:hypothetical protein